MRLHRYVIIRDMEDETTGLMHFRTHGEEARIIVRAETPENRRPLRVLLVSGRDDGAVLDLGLLRGECGQMSLEWQGTTSLVLWDAVILAEDWPSARLWAAGMLGQNADVPRWRLAQAAADFLKFPQTDALLRAAPEAESVLALPR